MSEVSIETALSAHAVAEGYSQPISNGSQGGGDDENVIYEAKIFSKHENIEFDNTYLAEEVQGTGRAVERRQKQVKGAYQVRSLGEVAKLIYEYDVHSGFNAYLQAGGDSSDHQVQVSLALFYGLRHVLSVDETDLKAAINYFKLSLHFWATIEAIVTGNPSTINRLPKEERKLAKQVKEFEDHLEESYSEEDEEEASYSRSNEASSRYQNEAEEVDDATHYSNMLAGLRKQLGYHIKSDYEWDYLMQWVADVFQHYSPEQQAKLDHPQGFKKIAKAIHNAWERQPRQKTQRYQQIKEDHKKSKMVPFSKIRDMSDKEYFSNAEKIQKLMNAGLIDYSR